MSRRRRVEPMTRTREDAEQAQDKILLRLQWFALGMSVTCLLLAASLPGFWQTGALMFVVAAVIGVVRRRYIQWSRIDTVQEATTVITLPIRKAVR